MHILLRKNRENWRNIQLKQVNDLYFQHDLYFQRLFFDFTMNLLFKVSKNWFAVALDESEDHEKKSFPDESFRLIDNDKDDNKSDSGQNSVESDNDNFTLIYNDNFTFIYD